MLELVFFALLGVGAGIVFGLIPGLHPNNIIIFTPFVASFGPVNAVAFLVSLGISNIIIDFIPSILLGAPDAGSELSVLPGQRLMMAGQGYAAIKLMIFGFITSFFIFLLLLPLLYLIVPYAFELSRHVIFAVLIFISCIMIFTERRVLAAFLVFFLSGIIGILSSNIPVSSALL
ncbi:MAG: tripartite tricarboxylate transporter permease, partial [Candidatus Aenigmarchaeota archaeon]|nr:tripartite tricarboxylate transporter permease [Candidatus Aenigmarchaeota archaeon]MDI6722463.1 tripartite tricarboxylate transporter permease [Candidatus Aenigmarchaeota archaeon]